VCGDLATDRHEESGLVRLEAHAELYIMAPGGSMPASQGPHAQLLRDLAGLIVSASAESVSMVKRGAPDHAVKLRSTQEWKIYLEFLKIFFNLADRLAAFHLPLKERPEFMNSLEDNVSRQLNSVLAPALGSGTDEMEVVMTIGTAVAESRQVYERFAFVVTEESPVRADFLQFFGERVAHLLDAPGNGLITSTAGLCASAAIPAISAAFEGRSQPIGTATLESGGPPDTTEDDPKPGIGNEIKLVSVVSALNGDEVETRWGLHPRFRHDLKPDEIREVSRLMNRVARILGERYAAVAFSPEWAPWQQIGHA